MFVENWNVTDKYKGNCECYFEISLQESLHLMHRLSEKNAVATIEKSIHKISVDTIDPVDTFLKYISDTFELLPEHLQYLPKSGEIIRQKENIVLAHFKCAPKVSDAIVFNEITINFRDSTRVIKKGTRVLIDPHEFYLAQLEGNPKYNISIDIDNMVYGVNVRDVILEYEGERHAWGGTVQVIP